MLRKLILLTSLLFILFVLLQPRLSRNVARPSSHVPAASTASSAASGVTGLRTVQMAATKRTAVSAGGPASWPLSSLGFLHHSLAPFLLLPGINSLPFFLICMYRGPATIYQGLSYVHWAWTIACFQLWRLLWECGHVITIHRSECEAQRGQWIHPESHSLSGAEPVLGLFRPSSDWLSHSSPMFRCLLSFSLWILFKKKKMCVY